MNESRPFPRKASEGGFPDSREDAATGRKLEMDRKVIEALEKPLLNVLLGLRTQIESGTYRIIVGDDASGRIPTLLLSSAISSIYKKQGMEKPVVRFIAGVKYLSGSKLADKELALKTQVDRMLSDANMDSQSERALIVTEIVSTGVSTEFLASAFYSKGVPVDVATVALSSHMYRGDLDYPRNTLLVSGRDVGMPDVYKEELSGVMKDNSELFSRPSNPSKRADDTEEQIRQRSLAQLRINTAREIVEEISGRLVTEFFSDNKRS